MMQALEAGISSLRRAIRSFFDRKDGSRDELSVTSPPPPPDPSGLADGSANTVTITVNGILDRTAADLQKLTSADAGSIDAQPILDRAMHEFAKLGCHPRPEEACIVQRYLQQLPDRDYEILRYFKKGRKQSEIAELMGMTVDSVRRSLATTYAELRVQLMNPSDGDDGGMPNRVSAPSRPLDVRVKQTSLRY